MRHRRLGRTALQVSEPNAGPGRRIGALLYDLLIVAALLIVATGPVLITTGGEAVQSGTLWYQLYLGLVVAAYFAGFWWRRGQTIGMVAWRLQLRSADGRPVTLQQSMVRSVAAVFSWGLAGVGVLWMLVDRERRTWHDLLSGTRVVFAD